MLACLFVLNLYPYFIFKIVLEIYSLTASNIKVSVGLTRSHLLPPHLFTASHITHNSLFLSRCVYFVDHVPSPTFSVDASILVHSLHAYCCPIDTSPRRLHVFTPSPSIILLLWIVVAAFLSSINSVDSWCFPFPRYSTYDDDDDETKRSRQRR